MAGSGPLLALVHTQFAAALEHTQSEVVETQAVVHRYRSQRREERQLHQETLLQPAAEPAARQSVQSAWIAPLP